MEGSGVLWNGPMAQVGRQLHCFGVLQVQLYLVHVLVLSKRRFQLKTRLNIPDGFRITTTCILIAVSVAKMLWTWNLHINPT